MLPVSTIIQATKTVASAGTPEKLAPDGTYCDVVLLEAKNARGTNNTGTVWIGNSATNDAQLLALAAGTSLQFSAPPGKTLDLGIFYIDVATAGDGVTYTALN